MLRRQFLHIGGAALAPFSSLFGAKADPNKFYFAVVADTHIIDKFYKGPEGNPEDTASIFETSKRLAAARKAINRLKPAVERVFVVGDYFHDYPSTDLDFYFRNKTRIDHAKALTDGFRMPVHVGFGNHDYAVPNVSRENTHELFRRKLGVKPYYSVEHKGWKFVHLNNCLGDTWNATHASYNKRIGSLGEEQLQWFETELEQHKPTFVFVHFPLEAISPTERADFGLHTLLAKHRGTVQRVISGHWHRWVDVADKYGPPHLVIAATRYDPDAWLMVEVDSRAAAHRLLNLDLVEWNTHYSKPFHFE
jgi:UDP-2,3-diacylglucosamine pyrophosphatase LpxH